MDNKTPRYLDASAVLNDALLDYEKTNRIRLRTLRAIAAVIGVGSPTTVAKLLAGVTKPRRSMAVALGHALGCDDPFRIARAYGYEELSEDSSASIPELLAYVRESAPWSLSYKAEVIERLERAQAPRDAYDAELVADLLRKPWPLVVRAERIAAMMFVAEQHALAESMAS